MHTIKRLNINLRDIFGRKKMGEGMGFSPNGQKIIIASLVHTKKDLCFKIISITSHKNIQQTQIRGFFSTGVGGGVTFKQNQF